MLTVSWEDTRAEHFNSESDTLLTLKFIFSVTPLSNLSVSHRRCSKKQKRNRLPCTLGNDQAHSVSWHKNSTFSSVCVGCIFLSRHDAEFMFCKLYELRASIAFSHRVCNVHCTNVDVVCVPWVTLNGDIIGHYCPLLSVVNDWYMSTSNLKIAAHNHYHPDWARHRLRLSQTQETTANCRFSTVT